MSKQWTKNDGVVWEELGAEALLVQPRERKTWRLNPVAAYLWKHCNGATSLRQMAVALARGARATGAGEARRIERDLSAFCAQLEAAGLLAPARGAAVCAAHELHFAGNYQLPGMSGYAAGNGSRRRPNARGVSGPA